MEALACPRVLEIMAVILDRAGGGYELQLAGFTVSQCCVDMAFTLRWLKPARITPDQRHAEIRIEGSFELVLGDATFRCDPKHDTASLAPALTLFDRTVEEASIDADGVLRIVFENRATITVPTDPNYEMWSFNSWVGRTIGPVSDRYTIIGGVGGEVVIFAPDEHHRQRPPREAPEYLEAIPKGQRDS
jgi:hypothetical protein